jgi:hypothetical protein
VTVSDVYFPCASLRVNFVEMFVRRDVLSKLSDSNCVSFKRVLCPIVAPIHIGLTLKEKITCQSFVEFGERMTDSPKCMTVIDSL